MSIYISPIVAEVRHLYADILAEPTIGKTVYQQLHQFADRLWEAYQTKMPIAAVEISNCHPDCLGKNIEQVFVAHLDEAAIQLTIAKEYGFQSWGALKATTQIESLEQPFFQALHYLLAGEAKQLQELLRRHRFLTSARCIFGHQATLLHYLGSNGVEIWRQVVPHNAVGLAELLLDFGADKKATMPIYGGHYDTLALASSSAHPKQAGLVDDLVRVLT